MLVGDILVEVRELIPDLPRTLVGPTGLAAGVVAAVGSTLPAATYNCQITAANLWGETLGSNIIAALVVGANQGIQITAPALAAVPGATKFRAYLTNAATGVSMVYDITAIPQTISTAGNPGQVPVRATAFYPDSDGAFLSAYTLYRWLNSALAQASSVVQGIPDMSGVRITANQGLYEIAGQWAKITNAWYDGWPLVLGGKKDLFYFNRVSSTYPWTVVVQVIDSRVVVEVQNNPDRTGASTTLANPLAINGTQADLVSAASFDSSVNLAKIGTEIVAFSNFSGNSLTGLIRGLGGTSAAAWGGGTAVEELNLRFHGKRLFTVPFVIGDALKSINIPESWREPLVQYLLNKARSGEQDNAASRNYLQTFIQMIKSHSMSNRIVAGPRQIGISDGAGGVVAPGMGSLGGGVIVP